MIKKTGCAFNSASGFFMMIRGITIEMMAAP